MQVRVQNLNDHPYKESFADKNFEFPPHGEIVMDEDDANRLISSFTPPRKDSQGRFDPVYFKKLRVHPDDMKALRSQGGTSLVCHANGQKASTPEELVSLLGSFKDLLAERDDVAEAEALKKQNASLRKENKEYKGRLELIEEKLGLRGETNDEPSGHA